jgi:hypothetical protein
MITYPVAAYYVAGTIGLLAMAGWGWVVLRQRGLVRQALLQPTALLVGGTVVPGGAPAYPTGAASGARVRNAPETAARTIWLTPERVLWGLHLATILAVSGALLHYAMTVIPGVSGRYLFPAFPSMAVVLAGGWLAWFQPRRQNLAAWLLGGAMLAAALYGLFGLLIPTYGIPRKANSSELRAMLPLDANIGDTALLLGYKVSGDEMAPGDTLAVTVYWRPLSRTDVPYTVFVHLSDPTLGPVAQKDTYPGQGNYATTVWDVGRTFVDTYYLTIPPEASHGSAELVIGLYDEASGTRLPVMGADAGAEGMVTMRVISIEGE